MTEVESITLGQAWEWLMAAAAAVYALAKAAEVIRSARRKLPCDERNEQMQEIARMLARDKERLDRQDTANGVMFRVQLAQIHHMLTGNGDEKLRQARNEIEEFLTKR